MSDPVAPISESKEHAAFVEMIVQSVRFANWAAGEGISPAAGQLAEEPEDFLMAWSDATGMEDWEGLDAFVRDKLVTSESARAEDAKGIRELEAAVAAAKGVLQQIAVAGRRLGPVYSHALTALHMIRDAALTRPLGNAGPGLTQPQEPNDG